MTEPDPGSPHPASSGGGPTDRGPSDRGPSDQAQSDQAQSDRGLSDRSRWNAGREVAIGERVVVRRHLRDGETSHLYTDVIGHVVALEPELVVRRGPGGPPLGSPGAVGNAVGNSDTAGEEVRIPDADIAVLKVLPPRVVRNRDIRALEYASALAWPGTEYALVDGWFCRAGDDWSYRGNSAVPVLPWASCEDLDGVRDWYADRGLPLRFVDVDRLVDAGRLRLDGVAVDPARVTAGRPLHLRTVDCDVILASVDGRRHDVRLADAPDEDWLALYHGTADLTPERVRPAMTASAALGTSNTDPDAPGPGGHVTFARYEIDGRLAAIARGAVSTGPDGAPRLAVSCVETGSDHRRQGLAEAVTGALAEWALGLGAHECHLHVFDHNDAGRGLWSRLGFTEHHALRHLQVD